MPTLEKGLPESEIYEQSLQYWPYLKSWKKVLEIIEQQAPRGGNLMDFMCGPGYLLGELLKIRPDLKLFGSDIDERYIPFAQQKYPTVKFDLADVLSWSAPDRYDVVTCTGSVHHLPYEHQEQAIEVFARALKPDGFAIISDCYIDDYANEEERKLVASKLGYEYLIATIKNGAPPAVIDDTVDIMSNDVSMKEFKTSVKKRQPVFEKYFSEIETIQTWPLDGAKYGDYITVCRGTKI